MRVVVSRAVIDVVRAAAIYPFDKGDAVQLGPNQIEISIADETIARIKSRQLEGESLDDTIIRVLTLAKSKGRLN